MDTKDEDLDQAAVIDDSFETMVPTGMSESEDSAKLAYGGYLNVSSIQIAKFWERKGV